MPQLTGMPERRNLAPESRGNEARVDKSTTKQLGDKAVNRDHAHHTALRKRAPKQQLTGHEGVGDKEERGGKDESGGGWVNR